MRVQSSINRMQITESIIRQKYHQGEESVVELFT